MPETLEKLALLSRTLDQTAQVLAATTAEQATLPTPCVGWDVSRLANHLIDDLGNFTIAAEGGQPDWSAAPSQVPQSLWVEVFSTEATDLRGAWDQAPSDARARIDQQIVELAVHVWDLSRATGQAITLDDDVAHVGLEWAKANLKPEFRGSDKAFGVQVPVPENASIYDQLIGFFGRDPGWG